MLPVVPPGWVHGAAVVLFAILFSAAPVQARYRCAEARIDTAVGAVLIALGLRLAVSR